MNDRMHEVANLISRMALNNATDEELERAIKYSTAVLDVVKAQNKSEFIYHEYNIAGLVEKYYVTDTK